MLCDLQVDLAALGKCNNGCLCLCTVNAEPVESRTGSVSLQNTLDLIGTQAGFTDGDDVACLYKVRGDIDLLAVNCEMSVRNKLSCFGAAHCEACAVDNVVQTALEQLEEVLALHTGHLLSQLEVMMELLLQQAVVLLCLLLLAELGCVLTCLFSALTVLAGGIAAAGYCTLIGIASVTLEEELYR